MAGQRRRAALSTPRSEVKGSLRIQVNGERREVENELTLSQLVSILKLKPEQIAIELNRTVVRRGDWSATVLRQGDTVEIVHFVGGGC